MTGKNICDKMEPLIYLWVGGELNENEEKKVKEHVATCMTCSRLLEEVQETYREIQDAAGKMPYSTNREKVKVAVLRQIVDEEQKNRKEKYDRNGNLRRILRWVSSAAALLFLFFFLYQSLWMSRRRLPEVSSVRMPSGSYRTEWYFLRKYRDLLTVSSGNNTPQFFPFEKALEGAAQIRTHPETSIH